MKYQNIVYSSNSLQNTKASLTEERHQKEFANLIIEKRLWDDLSNEEISVLELAYETWYTN